MRWMILALLPAAAAVQETGPPEAHVRRAVGWMSDSDPDLRAIARDQLVGFGKASVPAIEARLRELGAWELVEVLRKVDAPAVPSLYVDGEELEADAAALKANGHPAAPKEADGYLRAKYNEAWRAAMEGNWQKGFDLSGAIATLEPGWEHADKARRLKRRCDHMILQTTMLEAKIFQDRLACVEGQAVDLRLRIKNVFKHPITLRYDEGEKTGLAVLPIRITIREMGGHTVTLNSHGELRFESEIPIAPGAQWEGSYLMDTTLPIDDDKEVRVITVNAWTQPVEIDVAGRKMTKRIEFAPAVVKVVPKKYAPFLENPLEWLGKAMDTGITQEVYVCARLLEGEQKAQGVEMILTAMEGAKNAVGRNACAQILQVVTEQRLGVDPAKWREWWDGRRK